MKVLESEVNDPIFSATLMHLGIGLGFLLLCKLDKKRARKKPLGTLVVPMILSGVIIALLENGPIFIALSSGSASEVFAVKRLMPIFALIIGILWF